MDDEETKERKAKTTVKKKVVSLLDRNDLLYDMVDGVKVLRGVDEKTHNRLIYLIKRLKLKIDKSFEVNSEEEIKSTIDEKYKKIFSDLVLSTIMIEGKLSGVGFNEETDIDMLHIPTNKHILMLGCNFGEIYNNNAYIVEHPKLLPNLTSDELKDEFNLKKMDYIKNIYPRPAVYFYEQVSLKKKRGRKKKEKTKKKRKPQGSGKYMSSQITFLVVNTNDPVKIAQNEYTNYKIKIYRNGVLSVPGVKKSDMSDVIQSIKHVCEYWNEELVDEDVEILVLKSVMRNYTSFLIDKTMRINISLLEQFLNIEKELDFKRSSDSDDKISIISVQHTTERFSGLIIRFDRPDLLKSDKRSTIKILSSGKINIDGANSDLDAQYLYLILQDLMLKYLDRCLYDVTAQPNDVDFDSDDGDDESDSNESIYE
jgi:hypothetical protein